MKQYIFLKDSAKPEHLLMISPMLAQILAYVSCFCLEHSCIMEVSSIISTEADDKRLKRVSPSHREARAFDLSLKPELGWTPSKIKKLEEELEGKYLHIGAVAFSTGKPNVIEVHKNRENDGIHAHIQVRPF